MMESATPREMLKGLLQGVLPPRPLFLPIVFSLGARVENVPLRAFLSNPTKIFNSLRRVRAHLRADGVACYFDPFLEAEALGATLDWEAQEAKSGSPRLVWSQPAEKGTLPPGVVAPERAVRGGRVGVAIEVIRRLNAVLRDGSLLMAGVTGPFTLAARLAGLEDRHGLRLEDVPREGLEIAASLVTLLATAYVEAGANLIFIQEEFLPVFSSESCEDWASLLTPTLNIVRFYQALPVLHFSQRAAAGENRELIFQRTWDGMLCRALDAVGADHGKEPANPGNAPIGLALPLEVFRADEAAEAGFRESLHRAVAAFRPAILTTAGDVPGGIDMKRLLKILGDVPRAY